MLKHPVAWEALKPITWSRHLRYPFDKSPGGPENDNWLEFGGFIERLRREAKRRTHLRAVR